MAGAGDRSDLVEASTAITLRLREILRTTFKIVITKDDEWEVISEPVLLDAVEAAQQAYQDTRNSYPFAITIIKLHAIQAFWLAKLKPIRINRLQRGDGELTDPNINEKVAIVFLLDAVLTGIRTGRTPELFGHWKPSAEYVDEFLREYTAAPAFYKDKTPVEKSELLRETAFHMRYKNLTAVSLYEMMMHALIAARVRTLS